MTERVSRTDPPGEPEHLLDPEVPVLVTVDGQTWPGLAQRWRGRWVLCSWSRGVGLQHLGWVLGEDVQRVEDPSNDEEAPPPTQALGGGRAGDGATRG